MLNKIDLLSDDEREQRCQEIIDNLDWQGPVFKIAAINKTNTQPLVYQIMEYLEQNPVTSDD